MYDKELVSVLRGEQGKIEEELRGLRGEVSYLENSWRVCRQICHKLVWGGEWTDEEVHYAKGIEVELPELSSGKSV